MILFISSFFISFGQEYEGKIFEYQKDSLPYRILLPKNFNSKNTYPLLMVLHGAGERGNDNQSQLFHGSYLFQSEQFRVKYPAIVVFPQCPRESYWSSVERDYDTSLEKKIYQALMKINAPVKLTLYPEVKHDSWHNAFADPDLMQWLFSQQKK